MVSFTSPGDIDRYFLALLLLGLSEEMLNGKCSRETEQRQRKDKECSDTFHDWTVLPSLARFSLHRLKKSREYAD
jgi:hypothetical protein